MSGLPAVWGRRLAPSFEHEAERIGAFLGLEPVLSDSS